MAKYLVTGAAGFIGFHTTKKLLARGDTVVGYDNLVPYYPVEYKHARLKQLVGQPGFTFQQADLTERERLMKLCRDEKFDVVINLAAQAVVRYSLENPHAYVEAIVVGFVANCPGRNSDDPDESVDSNFRFACGCSEPKIGHDIVAYCATFLGK